MSLKIGIIAEDDSDVKVAEILLGKLRNRRTFQIKKFIGQGCGKIFSKCRRWADDLSRKGCTLLAIIHDLDQKNETDLRRALVQALEPSPIANYAVIIPIRELEAWLLSDDAAINRALRLN